MNFKNSILIFGIVLITGCTPKGMLPATELYPVQWFSGFDITEKLTKNIPVHNQQEVKTLLEKPWESPFQFTHLQTQETFSADRCSQILPDITQWSTDESYGSRQASICIAAESIAKARPAQYSFLSDFTLDVDFPLHAPKNLASIMPTDSEKERQRILQNKAMVSWADVRTVKLVTEEGEHPAMYAMMGGFQALSLIARGDFNHDNIEDILLYTEDYFVAGSNAHRLFWLTKTAENSPLTIIREYPMYEGTLAVTEAYQVQWFSDFAMDRMLEKKVSVHNQQDIRALLDRPWYTSVELVNLQTKEVFSADRCSQVLPTITQLETYKPFEFPSFRYLTTMCVAAQAIAGASSAQYSFLSDFKLDAGFPLYAPKNLASVLSSSEWKRISQNTKIVSWADVETVKLVSKEGEYPAVYAVVGGFSELSLIARGDFNHDNIEDILLYMMDYVVGGSHVSYQLFWLTKTNENSPITLIKKYPVYD